MVAALVKVRAEYGADLDFVVPWFDMYLSRAMEHAERIKLAVKAGAPSVWTPGQLARLWVLVRARRIVDPSETIEKICKDLAGRLNLADPDALEHGDEKNAYRRGYEVWAADPRSVSGEEVAYWIDDPQTLRRRYAQADRTIKSRKLVARFQSEAEGLAKLWQKASVKRPAAGERK